MQSVHPLPYLQLQSRHHLSKSFPHHSSRRHHQNLFEEGPRQPSQSFSTSLNVHQYKPSQPLQDQENRQSFRSSLYHIKGMLWTAWLWDCRLTNFTISVPITAFPSVLSSPSSIISTITITSTFIPRSNPIFSLVVVSYYYYQVT